MSIKDYTMQSMIYTGQKTTVYRGQRRYDGLPVVIKILNLDYPTGRELAKFRSQYEIAKHLQDVPGVIQHYSLEKYENTQALILEDIGGRALRLTDRGLASLDNKEENNLISLSLFQFLRIALQLVRTLGILHDQRIIHKDIKPQNIIFNPATGQVKITDFGIASLLSKENQLIKNPQFIEGTLAYISPEQTGRMNRTLDYRTDFYSLGVTFYELLTGLLPFDARDPMELVHSHLARQPIPPQRLRPDLPPLLGELILKLMAKTAEERYQTASGLEFDLQKCLEQLETKGQIDHFSLGVRDVAGDLHIPQKLYGREGELAQLLEAFAKVRRGRSPSLQSSPVSPQSPQSPQTSGANSQTPLQTGANNQTPQNLETNVTPHTLIKTPIILVVGYPGIGKSVLINEIHKPIVQAGGYFISGKFDQLQKHIPYAPLIRAFQELVRQILTETTAQISLWQEKLLAALGTNGQVIAAVIPEIELIIGKQPPLAALEATAAQNRFNLVFLKFVGVFTQYTPLVLFIDDLQWADSSSLNLIKLLITNNHQENFLFLGAYRDNEVNPVHPLMLLCTTLQETGVDLITLHLKPLQLADICELLADTLHSNVFVVQPLAKILWRKTQGNPFFLTKILEYLYQRQLLVFNPWELAWSWRLEEISQLEISDNVVELMVGNIQKLPPMTQQVLEFAACVGNTFSLQMLAIVTERPLQETAAQLWRAIEADLIMPLSDDYKLWQQVEELGDTQGKSGEHTGEYKFVHDRIQQAAYSLILEPEKQRTHLQIGLLLLRNTPPEKLEEQVFIIINQLNLGIDLITDPSQKLELADLNLRAGKKAKAANAYEIAVTYLEQGIKLLDNQSWQQNYALTLALYTEAVEAKYLNTDLAAAEDLSLVVLSQAKTLLERVRIYEIKIPFYISQDRMQEAVGLALEVLQLLGIKLPSHPHPLHIVIGLVTTKISLGMKKITDLENLPEMDDRTALAALRIIISATPAIFMVNQNLLPLGIFTMFNLCLRYGNSPYAAYAYAMYGLVMCGPVGDIKSGYAFGQLALKLQDRYQNASLKAKVNAVFNKFIRHWQEPAHHTIEPLQAAVQSGLDSGDLEYTGHASISHCIYQFFIGKELPEVAEKFAQYGELMQSLGQDFAYLYLSMYQQLVVNLIGTTETSPTLTQSSPADNLTQNLDENRTGNLTWLQGNYFDEISTLPKLQTANNRSAIFYLYLAKLILAYFAQDYAQAVKIAKLAAPYEDAAVGFMHLPQYNFYYSLSLLEHYPHVSLNQKRQYWRQVTKNQKILGKWAKFAPSNHQHKYDLIAAEKYRLTGKRLEAMDFYNQAIQAAKEQGYIQEWAISNELAAKFHFLEGRNRLAREYISDAYYGYTNWGAITKATSLVSQHHDLLVFLSSKDGRGRSTLKSLRTDSREQIATATTINDGGEVDLASVVKASQAFSGEIVFTQLLQKMMLILLENAGAQRGHLILAQGDKLIVAAAGDISLENVQLINQQKLEDTNNLPVSLIQYVARLKEAVVLDDATKDFLFAADSYICETKPLSILCTPIVSQSKLLGVLYLENNLIANAFTPARLEVLRLLSTQVAISIENASLYEHLSKTNLAYSKFVPKEFLQFLNHQSITDVQLGDQIQQEMTVMFSDIRSFTTISESMTPKENFDFINNYLNSVGPVIRQHQGFIDKFIGDGIMALFPTQVADAIEAAIAMHQQVALYNQSRAPSAPEITIGIGLHRGILMLGTVGEAERMQGTVIADAVNLAARLEQLTKTYGAGILVSEQTYQALEHHGTYNHRFLDEVQVKGKTRKVKIIEIFAGDILATQELKTRTKVDFEQGVELCLQQRWSEASAYFQKVLQAHPEDKAAQLHFQRCQQHLAN
jgi:predicted ATPase/class 3 adenylate cyclase/tRNA A-37 threonylcarbamoyl transferase component Bud32